MSEAEIFVWLLSFGVLVAILGWFAIISYVSKYVKRRGTCTGRTMLGVDQ